MEPRNAVYFSKYPALAIDSHITGTVDIGLGVSPEGDVGKNSRSLDGPPITCSVSDGCNASMEIPAKYSARRGDLVSGTSVGTLQF